MRSDEATTSEALALGRCPLLLLATGLKLIWLFAEPPPSVADNGDYWRVARPAGLEHVEGARIDGTRPSQWFRVIAPDAAAGLSSPVLIAATARALEARENQLDIRWVGVVHVALLLVVAGLGWKLGSGLAGGWRAGVLALFLVVLCHTAYLPFFNSFCVEGVLLIAVVGDGFGRPAPRHPVAARFAVDMGVDAATSGSCMRAPGRHRPRLLGSPTRQDASLPGGVWEVRAGARRLHTYTEEAPHVGDAGPPEFALAHPGGAERATGFRGDPARAARDVLRLRLRTRWLPTA